MRITIAVVVRRRYAQAAGLKLGSASNACNTKASNSGSIWKLQKNKLKKNNYKFLKICLPY